MEQITKHFTQLTTAELQKIYQLRVTVFVVEQQCPYQEVDAADLSAYHIWLQEGEEILAYLRLLPPGTAFDEAAIGRVIAVRRRQGLGSRILAAGIQAARDLLHADSLVLEAQVYARGLYEKAGFQAVSEEFLEDGIPHIRMRRTL